MSSTTQEIYNPALNSQCRLWLSGFLLLGMLAGLLGPLIVIWNYYLDVDPRLLGLHAAILNAACLVGLFVGRPWRRRMNMWACAVSAVAFVLLSYVGPPVFFLWRLLVLASLGLATGAWSARLGASIAPALHIAPARVANACGAYFGTGALLAVALLDVAYEFSQPALGPALLALLPLTYLLLTWKNTPDLRIVPAQNRNVRPIATSLLSVLLFFQIGNEWVLAVWLPFFLIHKLGASPSVAISLLALHFVFLLFGRWLAKALLPIVNHRRFLLTGIALSIAGYLVLATGHTLPSATTAVILVGVALGPVFPVAAETLDRNLSSASVQRILLAALAGATVGPFVAGFVCAEFGVPKIMFVPAVGALAVCVIAFLMMLESRLMGGSEIAR